MKNIYITGLFLLALLTGCDKFLEKEPENRVSVEVMFSDMAGAKTALTGVYLEMFDTDYYNGPRMVYPELTGGNVVNAGSRFSLVDVYRFIAESDSSSLNKTYTHLYSILANINNIIAYEPTLQDGSLMERNELLAQAYGLRALVHLDLVQLFAQPYGYTADASHLGIVLAEEPILVGDSQRRRATVAEVYELIEADLERALDLFANRTAIFTGHKVLYMNKSAVKALRARVCLLKGDWDGAYQYSNDVITEEGFSLYTQEEYVPSWIPAGGKETILEVGVPNAFADNALGSYYANESANSYFELVPSKDLLQLFTTGDVRNADGNFKYFRYYANATTVKLIRLSEMYLIRAEAAAETGQSAQALADLNTIRQRANPALSPWTDSDKDTLVGEILNERRRELYLEGFCFFDLMRRGRSVVRTDCEGLNCNVSYPSDRFVLPIPKQSVETNSNMEQNPGY